MQFPILTKKKKNAIEVIKRSIHTGGCINLTKPLCTIEFNQYSALPWNCDAEGIVCFSRVFNVITVYTRDYASDLVKLDAHTTFIF